MTGYSSNVNLPRVMSQTEPPLEPVVDNYNMKSVPVILQLTCHQCSALLLTLVIIYSQLLSIDSFLK